MSKLAGPPENKGGDWVGSNLKREVIGILAAVTMNTIVAPPSECNLNLTKT